MTAITTKNKSRENQSLERYLQEISDVSLLTVDEEINLAKKIRDGDQWALEKMTTSNLRFVVSVAKEYQNQGLSLGDLINEGNLGLIKAAKRFDETRGFKFISYAVWWIRQSILQALAEHSRVVRLPLNRVGTLNKISKVASELEQINEREPTTQEIAEELALQSFEVANTLKISSRHSSLDEPFQTGDKNSLIDVIPSDQKPAPDNALMQESLRIEIERVLDTLTEREKKVVKLYFGIEREKPLTLEEIGELFSLTRERVRQIKKKAIRRLRHKSRSRPLRSYLG
ncbi:RNA polymerase sigma factor RpoD/SigA [bacterium]|nr:RNA polymerase sigma factor RpoD/SigA [bacterium]